MAITKTKKRGVIKADVMLEMEVDLCGMNAFGTKFVGYMPDGTTYTSLVEVFGQPQRTSFGGQRQAEWQGTINGLIFTIYDYRSERSPRCNTVWHIGGNNVLTARLLNAYFKAVLNGGNDGN